VKLKYGLSRRRVITIMTNELKKAIEIVKGYLDMDSDVDSEYLNAQRTIIQALETQPTDKGEISDGYHTFNQLYHQRAILFATIVNQNKDKAWKSFKHSDGHYCFDSNGEWFIVGVDTPQGSYTYHYSKEYWDMFDCQELEYGKEWDGHTEEDVTRLLSLEQQPNRCDSCTHYEEQDGSNCYECVKGIADNFEAQPTNITVEMHPKEAIEILEHERDNDIFVTTEHRARIHQALTMGIKALKAQIKADECFNNTDSPMIRVNLEVCKDCYYNDGEVHGQCIICDKYRVILQADKRIEDGGE
jgi:hypothetical protein